MRDLALYDLAPAKSGGAPGVALAFSVSAGASAAWRDEAAAWLRIAGWTPQPIGDAPAWWWRAPWRC